MIFFIKKIKEKICSMLHGARGAKILSNFADPCSIFAPCAPWSMLHTISTIFERFYSKFEMLHGCSMLHGALLDQKMEQWSKNGAFSICSIMEQKWITFTALSATLRLLNAKIRLSPP